MKIFAKIPTWMLLCLFVLSPTNESMYSAALPSLSSHFRISGNIVQITSCLYFFGFAIGILSLGRLSDIFGRRPIVLIGLSIYIFSSIVSIFSVNIEMLMSARFCQAFGASIGSAVGQAMARDSYQGSQLSYVYSSLSVWLAIIPSVGSLIGGYIIEYSSWHYIFLFLTISVSLLFIIYFKYLPETNPYINVARDNKYFAILKVVLKDKIVWLYAFIIGAFNGITYGFYIEAPFIFVERIGLLPSTYGKLALLLSGGNICGGLLGSYLVKYKNVDNKKIIFTGLVFSLTGCSLLVISAYLISENLISHQLNDNYLLVAIIFAPIMLHMVAHNLLMPIALRYALENYGKVTGTAGSVFGSLYYILLALIIFIVSKLHSDSINNLALLFLSLSFGSAVAFYYIKILAKKQQIYKFN